MTVRFEQPGARLPATPEELAAYLLRKRERLTVEGTAHLRAAEAIAQLRRERGTSAEGDDVLVRLEREARRSADASWAAAAALRVDTTRAVDRPDAADDATGGAVDARALEGVEAESGGGGARGDRYRSDHLVTPEPVK